MRTMRGALFETHSHWSCWNHPPRNDVQRCPGLGAKTLITSSALSPVSGPWCRWLDRQRVLETHGFEMAADSQTRYRAPQSVAYCRVNKSSEAISDRWGALNMAERRVRPSFTAPSPLQLLLHLGTLANYLMSTEVRWEAGLCPSMLEDR